MEEGGYNWMTPKGTHQPGKRYLPTARNQDGCTGQAVCLLHSHRTFLLLIEFYCLVNWKSPNYITLLFSGRLLSDCHGLISPFGAIKIWKVQLSDCIGNLTMRKIKLELGWERIQLTERLSLWIYWQCDLHIDVILSTNVSNFLCAKYVFHKVFELKVGVFFCAICYLQTFVIC